jgi:hypothetical protein
MLLSIIPYNTIIPYGTSVILGLIILLSLKEIMLSSEAWDTDLNSSFNLAITPLLFCLAAIICYKLGAII